MPPSTDRLAADEVSSLLTGSRSSDGGTHDHASEVVGDAPRRGWWLGVAVGLFTLAVIVGATIAVLAASAGAAAATGGCGGG
jgi:hypothetical protein